MEAPTANASNVAAASQEAAGPSGAAPEKKVLVDDNKDSTEHTAESSVAVASKDADSNPAAEAEADTAVAAAAATEKRKSRSQSIREKLRSQERRLTSLVRNASGELDVIGQIKTVQENLQQVAAEKSLLEQELDKLKNATGEDDFLKEKMAGIQEGFDKQVDKIKSLLEEVNAKNAEIDMLRSELVRKLQRIVELEFDLETHDIHYTTYAADQFKLGEEALEEIKRRDGDESESSVSFGDASLETGKSLTPKKAQKLISKLLTDLENLEQRYKTEKVKSLANLEEVCRENEEMRTEITVLKKRLGDTGEKTSISLEEHSLVQLRREVETSEAKKKLLRKEVEKLKGEVKDLKKDSSEEAKRAQLDIDLLTNDNEAMKARIAELEKKSGGGGLLRKKKNVDKSEKFNEIESRLKKTYGELSSLRTSVEIKDKQISTLKQEVSNLRMRDIADGSSKDSMYTEFDTELLRAAPRRINQGMGAPSAGQNGEGADNDYVRELQKQLQDVQQQLVKKDQELVIERAKAASTAAGLLARITELTGKRVDGKTSKQLPGRFYM